MANDTSRNKTGDAQAAAENLASRAGAAAQKVGGAARSAGREVGAVAGEELTNLEFYLTDLFSTKVDVITRTALHPDLKAEIEATAYKVF